MKADKRVIHKQLTVDERFPLPARRLEPLVQQLLKVSKHEATRAIQEGGVRVNGRFVRKPATSLNLGDRIEVDYEPPAPPPAKVPKEHLSPQSLEIVFEDAFLVVVNKPAALLTVPTPHREKVTLISLLDRRLQQADRTAQAFCVHRLDRGVSGLLVFGKRLDVAEALRDQFAARKPERRYAAIVAGVLREREGTFRSHLATDKDLNRYSTKSADEGELAITHYRLRQQFADAALVDVELETGRRNQIRVHFAEAGHPVLGDPRYGRGATNPAAWPHKRLALHAQLLGFTHPVLGNALRFESRLPGEMQTLLTQTKSREQRHRKT